MQPASVDATEPPVPVDADAKTLLFRDAACVATFDDARTERRDAPVFIRGH